MIVADLSFDCNLIQFESKPYEIYEIILCACIFHMYKFKWYDLSNSNMALRNDHIDDQETDQKAIQH